MKRKKSKRKKPIRAEVKDDHIDVWMPDESELEGGYLKIRMPNGPEMTIVVDEMANVRRMLEEDEALRIFRQAHNFFQCQELIFASVGGDEIQLTQQGYVIPALVLGAFASELFIKCIICIEKGAAPHGHHLKTLFDELSEASMKELERLWNNYVPHVADRWDRIEQLNHIELPRTLSEALDAGGNAFEVLRYSYEEPKKRFRGYLLYDLPHMLGHRALQLKPAWLALPWDGKELYFDNEIEAGRPPSRDPAEQA